MAQNLLSIATDGYLCKNGNRNLVAIAVRGYLGCGGIVPPIPKPPSPDRPLQSPSSGGGWTGREDTGKRIKLDLKDPYKKKSQNDAILAVIKTFIKCQDEDIL